MSAETVKLEREGTRMVGHSRFGGVVIVIQYHDEMPLPEEMQTPANTPIYVGFDGEQGQPLDELLYELNQYRAVFKKRNGLEILADLNGRVHDVEQSQNELMGRVESIWNRLFKKPISLMRHDS